MKNLIASAFVILFASTAAYADEAYPAYTKDKSAWWISAMFAVPVVILDGAGRAIEATGKAGDSMQPLHKATKGILRHGVCDAPAVGTVCK